MIRRYDFWFDFRKDNLEYSEITLTNGSVYYGVVVRKPLKRGNRLTIDSECSTYENYNVYLIVKDSTTNQPSGLLDKVKDEDFYYAENRFYGEFVTTFKIPEVYPISSVKILTKDEYNSGVIRKLSAMIYETLSPHLAVFSPEDDSIPMKFNTRFSDITNSDVEVDVKIEFGDSSNEYYHL